MADYVGALVQLGTLAAGLLSQKQQQKEREKRENKELGIDAGRTRQDAAFDMLMQRAQQYGAPGASYLSTAARANRSIERGGADLKRNQGYYDSDHATDYLNPQVLGALGKSMASSGPENYGPSEPYSSRVAEDIAAPATSAVAASALAPSAAAAGVAAGASSELEEALRRYGYR